MARRARERDIESGLEPEKLPSVVTSEDGPASGWIDLPPVEEPSAAFLAQIEEDPLVPGDVEPPFTMERDDRVLDALLKMEANCASGGSCNLDEIRGVLKLVRGF